MADQDRDYPSPLREPTQYNGKLVKKRPWEEPPRSGVDYPEFQLNDTASRDYEAKDKVWVEGCHPCRSGLDHFAGQPGLYQNRIVQTCIIPVFANATEMTQNF